MSSKTCFAKSSCIVLASAFFCTSLPALAASSTAGTNLAIQQQDQKLKGQVIDAQTGDPVIGVNVLVKGTTNGTITDIDGKYELNAPAGAVLQISFIGYKTVEITATASEQTIKLQEDTETLEEVVVVAYGPKEDSNANATDAKSGTALKVAEVMPKFPGGIPGLMQYLARNIKYPTIAQKNKEQGRVILQMIVGKDGSISNIKVLRSISPLLDAEAIRVVSTMPKWEPGQQGGQAIAVEYTLPIVFKLQ